MALLVFPFTMELLIVVLFSIVAFPVWAVSRLLDAVEAAVEGDGPVIRPRSGRDRRQ